MNKVNFVWYIREDYRDGRRAGRGVLVRGGRAAQVIAQESMEEHIRGSVERLDNQFSTLHQDVATLSCEVLYIQIFYNVIPITLIRCKRITTECEIVLHLLNSYRHFSISSETSWISLNKSTNKLKIINSEKFEFLIQLHLSYNNSTSGLYLYGSRKQASRKRIIIPFFDTQHDFKLRNSLTILKNLKLIISITY